MFADNSTKTLAIYTTIGSICILISIFDFIPDSLSMLLTTIGLGLIIYGFYKGYKVANEEHPKNHINSGPTMREIHSKYTIKFCPVCGAVYCYGSSQCNTYCHECHSTVKDIGKTLQDYFDELQTDQPKKVQEYIRNKYIYTEDNKLYDPVKENKRLKSNLEFSQYIAEFEIMTLNKNNMKKRYP